MTLTKTNVFTEIAAVINTFNFESITAERKIILQPLVDYIQGKATNQQEIRLNLICTHNSRRSHLSQVWAQTAAAYYDIKNVFCYSGGTEATAMFPMVSKTLTKQGFEIKTIAEGSNPIYTIKYAENEHPIIGFSKTYDDDFNPQDEFVAIMTCSQADGGCPFIAGAEKRIPITFEDPKAFDNTPQQEEKYEERSLQIATEMFYVFSQIK
ncbi:arsenate reductase [Flavobacterium sp. 103]|jgi:arsenate reductase|uniref:Protein-tyrosine-phosphatase n=1 Tax=Flavobacterium aquariorum TaxID=2217670 RepID=A0A2W7TS04_9FLAO|nr:MULTISPECIES: protein-tyrosine-phosphatase [Flavobacterium]PVX47495.1 arsenate reductase [Flavobacterium sp. 103]PZX93343.1 protein-tyrosine-phosphatase [Flavobacterium aquariorum]